MCDSGCAAAPGVVYVSDWLTSVDSEESDRFVLKNKCNKNHIISLQT